MSTTFAVGRGSLPHSAGVLDIAGSVDDLTFTSDDMGNLGGAGLIVTIAVTAAADSPSVVFTVQGKDKISGQYYTLLASAAITGTGTTALMIHPALTAAANSKASALVPDVWRVQAVGAAAVDATMTARVSACLTP